jgi:hypothetical protein|tara:strand:+ start:2383 stop:2652 length:270 start_codon:yes stop_codon:yes gene_type:complete
MRPLYINIEESDILQMIEPYPSMLNDVTTGNIMYHGRTLSHLLAWVSMKMIEEQQLDEMCAKYPELQKARDKLKTAKEQFETMEALVKE